MLLKGEPPKGDPMPESGEKAVNGEKPPPSSGKLLPPHGFSMENGELPIPNGLWKGLALMNGKPLPNVAALNVG